ncbi:hypothetical protein FRC09_015113 [Ceratobasidium sp. 395]|nr:hypothetical protein FRC09_015113 [Ceratobasidium sp. 395]
MARIRHALAQSETQVTPVHLQEAPLIPPPHAQHQQHVGLGLPAEGNNPHLPIVQNDVHVVAGHAAPNGGLPLAPQAPTPLLGSLLGLQHVTQDEE